MPLATLFAQQTVPSHLPDPEEIERLLIAAQRNLRDAQITSISAETRFDAAYKAIMQSALAALMMHVFRPDTKRPGHHMTVVQSLPLTVRLEAKRVVILDTLRRQRNVTDYTGDLVDESTVVNGIKEAKRLLADVLAWRKINGPN